jgi:predicted ATPase/transcriptional regulator with XRE-family HTH domain
MPQGATAPFGARLKALRVAAGFTQEELATIAGLSVHAVSALERGRRQQPQVDTVRALASALDLKGPARDGFLATARAPGGGAAPLHELGGIALPVPLTALIGREADLETLGRWIDEPNGRLITLTGPGGVGKTHLAINVARAVADAGRTYVAFVALAALRDPGLVACAIAEALGLADISISDLARRARTACESRMTLLLLDNFEQVLGAAPIITDLLTSTTNLRLLVTSRSPLALRGEREYAVEPLALDTDSDATDVTQSPAVRLFAGRVRDVQPAFQVTSDNGPVIAAICRRLDALPLALELAAPWIKTLSVEELLRRLEHDVLLSAVGPRDLPERQQTMNATVAWSYELLGEADRRIFRRLGILPDRFPLDAVAAVAGDLVTNDAVVEVVARLIDRSLLIRAEASTPTRPLYRMLETVRAYAALELAAAGERDEALEGLIRYCRREAALAAEGLAGVLQRQWLNRVREDLESYRSALTWLLQRGRPSEAAAIARGVVLFWLIRGHAAEGLRWYDHILQAPLEPAVEAGVLVASSLMSYMQREPQRARERLVRALDLAYASGNPALVARAETMFGHIEHGAGNLAPARDHFARGAEQARALGSHWGIGSALSGLGGVLLAMGETAQALRVLDEATVALKEAGPWFLAPVRCYRATLALQRDNSAEAIALSRESLIDIRMLQDKYAYEYALLPLASAALLKGDARWAARILGAHDAVAERSGFTIAIALVSDLRARAERNARKLLGPERWLQEHAAGGDMSIDQLINDIDAHTARPVAKRRLRQPTHRRRATDS